MINVTPSPAVSGGGTLQDMADAVADQYGIARNLFRALINQESRWNPNAVSPIGARGLTQLMPATAADMGVTNLSDPLQQLQGGARYLAQQLQTFGGNVSLALAAYNAGPGNVRKYGGIPPFTETINYVKAILAAL